METVHSLHEEKEQLESKLVELQAELADQQIQTELLMQQLQESQIKLKYAETEAKLQCYEAVDIERKKWELREERLLDEVATLKKRKEPVNLGITQKRQLPSCQNDQVLWRTVSENRGLKEPEPLPHLWRLDYL